MFKFNFNNVDGKEITLTCISDGNIEVEIEARRNAVSVIYQVPEDRVNISANHLSGNILIRTVRFVWRCILIVSTVTSLR